MKLQYQLSLYIALIKKGYYSLATFKKAKKQIEENINNNLENPDKIKFLINESVSLYKDKYKMHFAFFLLLFNLLYFCVEQIVVSNGSNVSSYNALFFEISFCLVFCAFLFYAFLTFKKRNQLDFIFVFSSLVTFLINIFYINKIQANLCGPSYEYKYYFPMVYQLWNSVSPVFTYISLSAVNLLASITIFFLFKHYKRRKIDIDNKFNSKTTLESAKFNRSILVNLILIFMYTISQQICINALIIETVLPEIFFVVHIPYLVYLLITFNKRKKIDYVLALLTLIFITFDTYYSGFVAKVPEGFSYKVSPSFSPIFPPFIYSYSYIYKGVLYEVKYGIYLGTLNFLINLIVFILSLIKTKIKAID